MTDYQFFTLLATMILMLSTGGEEVKWNHIMDKQPEIGEWIVRCHLDFGGKNWLDHCRNVQFGTWEEFLKAYRHMYSEDPDFWWIKAEDFPFPKKRK